MSDTPERVWVKESHDSWGQYGHWYAHGKGGGTEYVRDNRIVELEAKLEKAAEALVRIALSDLYSVEANAEDQGAVTLEYAHKSICNLARTTLAELKGQDDEV